MAVRDGAAVLDCDCDCDCDCGCACASRRHCASPAGVGCASAQRSSRSNGCARASGSSARTRDTSCAISSESPPAAKKSWSAATPCVSSTASHKPIRRASSGSASHGRTARPCAARGS
ncbi:hypothetical protein BURPSS13_C0091 [Burkholderia pseudomallei S13]|nr:hypothetical protein BURPSS13_C0091 [Burkholderia pseudomallei S13]